jgi:methylenetetrahydrofolate reductase (NADPH)
MAVLFLPTVSCQGWIQEKLLKIRDLLQEKRTISCEFFPPRQADGIPNVLRAIDRVRAYRPDFVSVTYGAGGSTRAFTEEITLHVKRETDLEVMAHLTCVGQTREEIQGVLEGLDRHGIENIIALRGDPPQGQRDFVPVAGGFEHATALIKHIREHFRFGIAGACYPEGHIESRDLDQDIAYARLKVDKGADFLVTQLFYDNRRFFEFMDRAVKSGINVPVLPGVLPILSAAQIRRFTGLCGATIPPDLDRQLDRYADDENAVRDLGIEYATNQVRELWDSGVPGVHFYVLNRIYSVSRILENLGIEGHIAEPSD